MTTHRLKIFVKYADAIMSGAKTPQNFGTEGLSQMVTDEERREAIENLRCLSYMNRVRYKEEFYELLDETVMEPDTGYHEMNDVFERIADLIDRPTCLDLVEHKQDPFIPGKRMVDGYFHCSDCGWDGQIWEHIGFGDMLAYEAVHCPKCGAIIERRA